MSRFHAEIFISTDQTDSPTVLGPKRATAKGAIKIAVKEAIRENVTERVKIVILEDNVLLASGYGDTPQEAQDEMFELLDRNRRRY